jgi:hypothetical protein
LIDYEYTFDTTNFDALGNIAVALHPPNYRDLKARKAQAVSDRFRPFASRYA